jgi:adenylosuccinate lyase
MELTQLTAIGPVDGRYRKKTEALAPYFSEFGLIRYRVLMEIEYFIALANKGLKPFNGVEPPVDELRKIYLNFSEADAEKIKETEKVTNHDVKAVEYFVKERMEELGLGQFREMIHFGLTSQDINNTAIPLSMKHAFEEVVVPFIQQVIDKLKAQADEWSAIPMLAKTHGQPASPTRLGKEIQVFVVRLEAQLRMFLQIPYAAKFGGATGNFNAHAVAYPGHDWHAFAADFLGSLGLRRSHPTTQIEHYDFLSAQLDAFKRINTILVDYSRDIWTYVSMEYFRQKIKKGEVGSSAMPHKVNPIDFENAEGNLGIANALLEHLSAKLPISRLQRDLTDSTVLRNIGVPFAHMMIAYQSLLKGMDKLLLNPVKLNEDLEKNWAVVAEGIQTILRREGYPNPYEALKELTRTNEIIDEAGLKKFIENLDVNESVKEELKNLSPQSYTGI